MEEAEFKSKDEALRSQIAIRCAKAAVMLSTLKSFSDRHHRTIVDDQDKEKDKLRRAIGDLKVELVRERLKNRRIKLCGLMEVIIQLLMVMLLSSFFFVFAFNLFDF